MPSFIRYISTGPNVLHQHHLTYIVYVIYLNYYLHEGLLYIFILGIVHVLDMCVQRGAVFAVRAYLCSVGKG
jgi:hypothetical protein